MPRRRASGHKTGRRAQKPSRPWLSRATHLPQSAYERELTTFVEFAAGRVESPCTVQDALEAVYVAEACEISRRENRAVRTAEVRR